MRRFRDYRAVEIMLSDAVLFDHILADHPEPVNYVQEIGKALANPVVPAFPDPRRPNGIKVLRVGRRVGEVHSSGRQGSGRGGMGLNRVRD